MGRVPCIGFHELTHCVGMEKIVRAEWPSMAAPTSYKARRSGASFHSCIRLLAHHCPSRNRISAGKFRS